MDHGRCCNPPCPDPGIDVPPRHGPESHSAIRRKVRGLQRDVVVRTPLGFHCCLRLTFDDLATSANAFSSSNASTVAAFMLLGALADPSTAKVGVLREIIILALLPACPLPAPSISRPELSSKPDGGSPLTWSCTFLVKANGFLGKIATVSFAALYTAALSLMLFAFLAANDPLFPAVTRR